MSKAKHEDIESFYAAEYDDQQLVFSPAGESWQAFETEDGEWYAVRPRNEEDPEGPAGDRWRPIGPVSIEEVPLPFTCVYLGHVPYLEERAKRAEERASDLSWRVNPDRMGR